MISFSQFGTERLPRTTYSSIVDEDVELALLPAFWSIKSLRLNFRGTRPTSRTPLHLLSRCLDLKDPSQLLQLSLPGSLS